MFQFPYVQCLYCFPIEFDVVTIPLPASRYSVLGVRCYTTLSATGCIGLNWSSTRDSFNQLKQYHNVIVMFDEEWRIRNKKYAQQFHTWCNLHFQHSCLYERWKKKKITEANKIISHLFVMYVAVQKIHILVYVVYVEHISVGTHLANTCIYHFFYNKKNENCLQIVLTTN